VITSNCWRLRSRSRRPSSITTCDKGDCIKGKHALVTGSSRGIGRGIALKLAERGARVAVHYYQNEDAAKGTLGKIRECGSARKPSITAWAYCAACIASITDRRFPATTLSAQVYYTLSARLWPSATEDHYQSATAAAVPCDRAPVRRPSGAFLERLSHLPRSRRHCSDVARRPTLLLSAPTPAGRSLAPRSPPSRSRQGSQTACRAPARRNPSGAPKLSPLRETFDQLARSVCFSQRPPARTRHDRRRSLFRHHRLRSRVPQANPHRFRHTFGTEVRAGMSCSGSDRSDGVRFKSRIVLRGSPPGWSFEHSRPAPTP
jgi:short chain dehydrogenase